MAFLPPLILLISALNFYIFDKPLVGNLAKFVVLRNPDAETESGKWRDPVWVDTSQGRMKGTQEFSRTGKNFYWFRGIPYAKSPVGQLRYEPPEPHEGWKGTFDATSYGSGCSQINFITRSVTGSEDCLFLNVATRKVPGKISMKQQNRKDLYPVLFFIHGGLFMWGQANPFGPKYFMDEEVVLVSMNYRLNSYGFLNTGDGVVQGNMGLKDQVVALQWVQENIRYFNGDPEKVTLIGESAGAACVHLHTLSPMSQGLFSGAISLSGTALSPWAQIDNPEEQAKEFGEELGCPSSGNDTQGMVQCLKGLDAMTVTRYHQGALIAASQGKNSLFAPTVDSGTETLFLPDSPLELMRTGQVSDRPWITGVNSGDGLVYLIAVLRNETMRRSVNERWDYIAPKVLKYQDHPDRSTVTRDVSQYYLNNEDISQERINEANAMLSDRGFFLDSHDAAIMQSQVAPTYVYYYTYEGVFSGGNMLFTRAQLPVPNDYKYIFGSGLVWLNSMLTNKRQKSKFGICHGDEMPLLFNVPLIRREVIPGDPDYEFSRKLVGLWVSFAEDGIPDTTRAGVIWDPVSVPNSYSSRIVRSNDIKLKRLLLDKDLAIINEPFYDRMLFWRNHSISYLPE